MHTHTYFSFESLCMPVSAVN